MNFFGHAAVASWSGGAPVALGAMLPDFATMCGGRLSVPSDPGVAAGIDLHHATDAAFHRAAPVVALMRELDATLAALGCARGPRRAVAHIGIELLLDGVLVDDAAYRDSYVAGLACDPASASWREPGHADRFAVLIARLRDHGVPYDLKRPAAITVRLGRMLGHRPLLAPSPDDLRAIERALTTHQPRVEIAASTVMRSLSALAPS